MEMKKLNRLQANLPHFINPRKLTKPQLKYSIILSITKLMKHEKTIGIKDILQIN